MSTSTSSQLSSRYIPLWTICMASIQGITGDRGEQRPTTTTTTTTITTVHYICIATANGWILQQTS